MIEFHAKALILVSYAFLAKHQLVVLYNDSY